MTSGMGLKPSNLPGVWEQHKKGWDSGDKGTGGWRARDSHPPVLPYWQVI